MRKEVDCMLMVRETGTDRDRDRDSDRDDEGVKRQTQGWSLLEQNERSVCPAAPALV